MSAVGHTNGEWRIASTLVNDNTDPIAFDDDRSKELTGNGDRDESVTIIPISASAFDSFMFDDSIEPALRDGSVQPIMNDVVDHDVRCPNYGINDYMNCIIVQSRSDDISCNGFEEHLVKDCSANSISPPPFSEPSFQGKRSCVYQYSYIHSSPLCYTHSLSCTHPHHAFPSRADAHHPNT